MGGDERNGIPSRVLREWQLRALKKCGTVRRGREIPMDRLRERGRELFGDRFPAGAAFDVGGRVNRFWADGADAESVLVRADGLTCFTGDKGFVGWGDVFGEEWVRGETQAVLEEATAGVWWCPGSGKYYVNGSNTGWQALGREDVVRWMKARGVSAAVGKGEQVSELDMALLFVQKKQSIHGVFPRVFAPDGVFRWNGKVLLNTSTKRLMLPGPATMDGERWEWGVGFEKLAGFLETGFREQLRWWLGYWAHAYRSALTGEFTQGMIQFIAGPPDSGKTFLGIAVWGKVFDGAPEATRHLIGEEPYNAELVESYVWRVDDAMADATGRRKFEAKVKAIAANRVMVYRQMYTAPGSCEWLGRVVVTMNDDPQSIRMLPGLEASTGDKLMILKMYARDKSRPMPSDAEIERELPAFLRHLVDMDLEGGPDVWVGGRYGVVNYQHPDLVQEAQENSDTQQLIEILEEFREWWYGAGDGKETYVATPSKLLNDILTADATKAVSAKLFSGGHSEARMGRMLTQITEYRKDVPWLRKLGNVRVGGRRGRFYTLERPE